MQRTDRPYPAFVLDVVEAAIAAANEDPERVYSRESVTTDCLYQPTPMNPKGCLIGCALRTVGYPEDEMDRLEMQGAQDAVMDAWTFITGEHWEASPAARIGNHWMEVAQSAQDRGFTWSEAVRQADENEGAVRLLLKARQEARAAGEQLAREAAQVRAAARILEGGGSDE
jgi:hypothetical protein